MSEEPVRIAQPAEGPHILKPDYELTEKIEELNSDIKFQTAFALGGVAVTGAFVGAAYGAWTGKIDGNAAEVFKLPIGLGVPTIATVGAIGITQNISSRKERRGLKKEQKRAVKQAAEHYADNKEFYQEEALNDAANAGVLINK